MTDGPSRDELVAELEALRAENARLRALLGLEARRGEMAAAGWSPTLFRADSGSAAANTVGIDRSSSREAKVALFRWLFAGREDVYALRWENQRTGKGGWGPAVRGGWANARRPDREHVPWSNEVAETHLAGKIHAGLYPLLPGDVCRLLACDFDGSGWVLDALAYLDAARVAGVPAALERSRSGDGGHVWVLFASPVPAASARRIGVHLLREAMTVRAELDLVSYDRLFPAQDFMPKGSFGNLIALPLQGDCRKRGTTVFLDPSTLEPYEDQWAFLASVERLAPDAVDGLASAFGDVATGPEASTYRRARTSADAVKPPPQIPARAAAMLEIDRIGVPPALLAALKHTASLHNPEFYEKERMRFSTWNTPRFIRCYRETLDQLLLPRGLRDKAQAIVAEAGSRLQIVDLVASLVAKSLVGAEEAIGSVRYTLLETLRQYGAERLQESGETNDLARRHAAHFASFAHAAGSGLRGPDELWWVGRLDQEFDNLRAGHGWAVATGDADCALGIIGPLFWHAFWRLRSEIFSWAKAALELSGAADHPLLPAACALAGWGPVLQGDFAQAHRLSEEAFAGERRLGLAPDFPARFLHGELLRLAGDLDTGAEHYEACVLTARDKGDSWELAMVLAAHVYTLANGARLHRPHAEEAVALARAVGNPTASAYALHAFGESLMEAEPQRSLALHEAAAAAAGSVGDALLEGMAPVSLTSLRGRLAEPLEALSGYLELIGRWQRQGSWLQQWILLRNLLELLARLDSYEAAAFLYGAVEVSPAPPPPGGAGGRTPGTGGRVDRERSGCPPGRKGNGPRPVDTQGRRGRLRSARNRKAPDLAAARVKQFRQTSTELGSPSRRLTRAFQ